MIPESVLSFFHAGKSLPFRSMTVFNFLLEATLAGSILIVVMLILRRAFRKQIGSRMVYLAWAMVAIRLLAPLAIPNPLMNELRPTYSLDVEARPVADQFRVRYQDALSDASRYLSVKATENQSQALKGMAQLTLEVSAYTAYGWLGKGYLLIWLAGATAILGVFGARHIRFRRGLTKNKVGSLEGERLSMYQALCERLNVKPLPVLCVDPLPSPCLVGVIRPVIAIPLTLRPDALPEALCHELYHYRAKDSWWALLRCVCCAVHWFNPLVWIAQRVVKTDCELACDARIAAGLNREQRLHYANTLIGTAKAAYAPKAGVLSTGLTMTGKRLKERINAIINMRAVRKAAAIAVAVPLALLTVFAFSTAESISRSDLFKTDQSAFPFIENEAYPAPDNYWGDPVPLAPLTSAALAQNQAEAYLSAIYSYGFGDTLAGCQYEARLLDESAWQVVAYARQDGKPLYYVEMGTDGSLYYLSDTFAYAGANKAVNVASVLPRNLNEVLRIYGQRMVKTIFGGTQVDTCLISDDFDYPAGRVLQGTFLSSRDDSVSVFYSIQIAPRLKVLAVSNNSGERPKSAPVTNAQKRGLVYSKDSSIACDAVDWGQTDSQYAVPDKTELSLQKAFDLAVEAMLGRADITPESIAVMYLRYGYYPASNTMSETGNWYFVWYLSADMEPTKRYWATVRDATDCVSVDVSAPGEGLG